jgi:hypothetical protein
LEEESMQLSQDSWEVAKKKKITPLFGNKYFTFYNSILKNVDDYLLKETHNQLMIEKLLDVKKTVISETLDVIDDDTITRFMLYTKLSTEFSSKE